MPRPTRQPAAPSPKSEVVDPVWLIKAFVLVLFVAFLCSYLTLCVLFYQGQWQIVLHPVHNNSQPPATPELLHFGPDESAIPQLAGVWLPAAQGQRYATTTILFLPGGNGARSDFDSTIELLHNLGLNVFAFDYRGYGYSASTHPTQQRMTQDTESAWRYLTLSRNIPSRQIVPYGVGVGASLAARLAGEHPEIPALILDSPYTDLLEVARQDARSRFIPVEILFHERFPLAASLASLPTPKLLLTSADTIPTSLKTAAEPKFTVEFGADKSLRGQSITRFLDQYLTPSPSQLVPTPAPSATNSN